MFYSVYFTYVYASYVFIPKHVSMKSHSHTYMQSSIRD